MTDGLSDSTSVTPLVVEGGARGESDKTATSSASVAFSFTTSSVTSVAFLSVLSCAAEVATGSGKGAG